MYFIPIYLLSCSISFRFIWSSHICLICLICLEAPFYIVQSKGRVRVLKLDPWTFVDRVFFFFGEKNGTLFQPMAKVEYMHNIYIYICIYIQYIIYKYFRVLCRGCGLRLRLAKNLPSMTPMAHWCWTMTFCDDPMCKDFIGGQICEENAGHLRLMSICVRHMMWHKKLKQMPADVLDAHMSTYQNDARLTRLDACAA